MVRGVGSSFPAKLSILMLFVGYLILLNDSLAVFFDANIQIRSQGIFKLYFFYVGSVFVGAASILYYIRCPEVVREFSIDGSYVAESKRHFDSMEFNKICERLSTAGNAQSGKFKSISTIYSGSEKLPSEEILNSVFYAYYMRMARSNYISMIICTLLYAVGIVLIMVPTFISMLDIFRVGWAHTFNGSVG
jgi:hypothetical protein